MRYRTLLTTLSSDDPRSRAALFLLGAILLFALMVRVYLFRGFLGLDDAEYARIAYQMGQGTFVRSDYTGPVVFPLRVGVIAPTAVLFHLFGVSEWSMVGSSLLLSLAGIVLVYVCGSLFFGARAGLIASALLAVFPFDVESATKLIPDLPCAFYGAAGLTSLFLIERLDARRGSWLFLGGLLAGLCFGASWLSKEATSFLAPFCAVLLLSSARRDMRRTMFVWGGVAAGAFGILVAEMLAYRAITGDLLFRFHQIEHNYQQNQKYFFMEGSLFGWETGADYRRALLDRLFVSGPAVIFLNRSFLYVPLVAAIGTVYAAWRRDRAFLVPAIWFWTLALMFLFSSTSTKAYIPLVLTDRRYVYSLYYPSIVLAAGFLATTILARPGSRVSPARWIGVAAAAVICYVGATELALSVKYPPRWLADVRRVRSLVTPETPVYSDSLTLRAFEFFSSYPARTSWVDFQDVASAAGIAPGSLVVVNPPYIAWLDSHGGIWGSTKTGYRQHAFYTTPPASWTPLSQTRTLAVYRAGGAAAENNAIPGGKSGRRP